MKKFEQELEALRQRVAEMGRLAQSMVDMAIDAIVDLHSVYPKVLQAEEQIDQMQLEIDREAVRLLTVYSPVAANLRFVLCASHVNNALERIGDQAVSLCHNLDFAGKHAAAAASGEAVPKLQRMAERVQAMMRDALLAFLAEDASLARATMAQDDYVDSLNDQIVKEMLSDDVVRQAMAGPRDLAEALSQILIGRSLERIGDQAVNICEEVIYSVRGDDVRHSNRPHTAAG
jgi:phosphate transport system protein